MVSFVERLETGIFVRSRSLPPPWGPVLRLLRYPAAVLRDWMTGDLSVRATSLAYTTLLSIVPLLAFSFSVLKGLGARGNPQLLLREFFRPVGAAGDQLSTAVLQFVANVRGDVLGSVGLVFLLYTVISTIQKVEASFNVVWRIDRPRGMGRRLVEYLGAIVLAPILFAATLGLLAAAAHGPLAQWIGTMPALSWLATAIGRLVPTVVVTAVFTSMYVFVPNTRVDPRAALTGGVAAGVLWAIVGRAFTAFLVYSSQLMAVYTGFAILLSTLVWVYVSWLILFIGAQLAFYVQFPQCLRPGRQSTVAHGRAAERAALAAMIALARRHSAGGGLADAARLAAELDLPVQTVSAALDRLERAGLVARTDRGEWLPARAPQSIGVAEVLEAARGAPGDDGRQALAPASGPSATAAAVVQTAEEAVRARLGGRRVQDLMSDG